MKPTLATRKPRNPFVALARSRSGGRHGSGNRRQQMQRELRGELRRMRPSP